MSAEHKQTRIQLTPASPRKTYFRLRELRQTLIANKAPSPPKHYDYYSYQKNLLTNIKPIENKMRNTSFNFKDRVSPTVSPKEQSKEVPMRRTFYGSSKASDLRPLSSSRSIFGRSSLNFHQQNIFKD